MIRMHTVAMSVPLQPFIPDELKHCGVDGHAVGLPLELGAKSKIQVGFC